MIQDLPQLAESRTPHFALARQGIAEVVVTGASYWKVAGESVTGDDPGLWLVARSLLKPWQFLATSPEIMGTAPYWALGLASHSGQSHHREALSEFAAAVGVSDDQLICPRSYPMDAFEAFKLQQAKEPPARLHHPCAGKHLTALAFAKARGWSLEHYWDLEHPLQKQLSTMIGQQIGEKPLWMTDSCGLPTIAMPVRAHLKLWERFITSQEPAYQRVKSLWLQNYRLVGGIGRLESDIMEFGKGKLLAKEGADGLLVVASLPQDGELPATAFIKLASGYQSTYLALALWSLLARTKTLTPIFSELSGYLRSRLEGWIPRDQELLLPPFK